MRWKLLAGGLGDPHLLLAQIVHNVVAPHEVRPQGERVLGVVKNTNAGLASRVEKVHVRGHLVDHALGKRELQRREGLLLRGGEPVVAREQLLGPASGLVLVPVALSVPLAGPPKNLLELLKNVLGHVRIRRAAVEQGFPFVFRERDLRPAGRPDASDKVLVMALRAHAKGRPLHRPRVERFRIPTDGEPPVVVVEADRELVRVELVQVVEVLDQVAPRADADDPVRRLGLKHWAVLVAAAERDRGRLGDGAVRPEADVVDDVLADVARALRVALDVPRPLLLRGRGLVDVELRVVVPALGAPAAGDGNGGAPRVQDRGERLLFLGRPAEGYVRVEHPVVLVLHFAKVFEGRDVVKDTALVVRVGDRGRV